VVIRVNLVVVKASLLSWRIEVRIEAIQGHSERRVVPCVPSISPWRSSIPFSFLVILTMSRRRSKPRDLSRFAAELSHEDGTDPREFHAKPFASRKQAGRKCDQLCEQVRQSLQTSLEACGDSVMQSLIVVDAEPAAHSGRLRIRLQSSEEGLLTQQAVLRLERASGHLRSEVAAAIHRRYAPELVFEVQ